MADDGVVLARYTPKVQPQTDNGVSLDSNARTSGHHSNGNANHVKGHDPEKSPRNGGDVRIEDAPEEESDPCGWGPFTFSWCQRLRDPRWFVVVITLCGACQVSLCQMLTSGDFITQSLSNKIMLCKASIFLSIFF